MDHITSGTQRFRRTDGRLGIRHEGAGEMAVPSKSRRGIADSYDRASPAAKRDTKVSWRRHARWVDTARALITTSAPAAIATDRGHLTPSSVITPTVGHCRGGL
jgi:hypothetical protein